MATIQIHLSPARLSFYGFLLAALILSIAAPARQTGAQPPAWLTFTDPDFGWQIRYPAGWVPRLAADNIGGNYSPEVALRSVGFFGPGSQIVFVDVWRNEAGLSPAAWLERYPPPVAAGAAPPETALPATVAGRPALRLAASPPQSGSGAPRHYRIQFSRDGWMFAVEYAALEPELALYRDMVNSFVFLAESPGPTRQDSLSTDLPPAEFGVGVATCCGTVDPEYNPFPCNTAGDASCPSPPCGNCTWWVRYRRAGDTVANLVHCTGDALTWQACAAQYYPTLLSSYPDAEAVTLYPGVDHLSFVEELYSAATYGVSDLSWYASCPANYYAAAAGGGKQYILHPYRQAPNQPPNPPLPGTPADEAWLASRSVTLSWLDGGDPDDGPAASRDFLASIEADGGWNAHSGWQDKTAWSIALPADGRYAWRVKAHDGNLESNWSDLRHLRVDSTPPIVTLQNAPPVERWYNTDQTLAWAVSDPAPGSGLDHFNREWDDPTPDVKINAGQGTAVLSAAGQGQHTLYLQAWDVLGNASALTAWGWFGYDTLPPAIELQPGGPVPGGWRNAAAPVGWAIADPAPGSGGSLTRWGWDSSPPIKTQNGSTGSAFLPQTQGWHTLYLQAEDAAGNTGPMQSVGNLGFDSLPPEPPVISVDCAAPNNQWQSDCRAPVFGWAAADPAPPAGSGVVEYAYSWGITASVSPGNWSGAAGFAAGPVAPPGGQARYYLHVQARDAAGNISSPATFGLWYDGAFSGPPLSGPEQFLLRLNDGAWFTNAPTLTVSAAAPNVVEVRLSSEPDSGGQGWQAAPLTAAWVISAAPSYFTPRRVYARFRNAEGTEYGPYFDDIIYDPIPPRGRVTLASVSGFTATLSLPAQDDNSGLAQMRLGTRVSVTQTVWQSYAVTATRPYTGGVIYAQFRDRAGNASSIYGTDGSDSHLTERLYLPLIWVHRKF